MRSDAYGLAVSTADPDRSVMVYSNPDDDVTVIWVFNPMEQDEQS